MAIQKINYNPSFGAKVSFVNRHRDGKTEPGLTSSLMRDLKEKQDLPDGQSYRLLFTGFDRLDDPTDSRAYQELSIAIVDKNSRRVTDDVVIMYELSVTRRGTHESYQMPRLLANFTDTVINVLQETLQLQKLAKKLGYKLVKL